MKRKIISFLIFAFVAVNVLGLNSDAYLSNLTLSKYLKANYANTITVWIRNANNNPITQCNVNWQLDNGTVNTQFQGIGGSGVILGNYMPITFSTPLNIASAGSYKFKIWVSDVYLPDINHANDTIKMDIIVLSNYVNKKVLIEEITATSCQYCPPANTVINTIANNPNAVVAAFHLSDIYSFTNGTNYIQSLGIGGTPKALINLGEMGTYANNTQYDAWQSEVTSRMGISPVDLQFTPVYNATTRLLTINSTVNFKYALTGDFYLNVYVLESGIIGTQTNATNPYTHNHVVRAMLGGINGISGVIPASPVINSNYSHQDTITIPTNWNAGKLEIIAYVFEKNTSNQKNVLNAAKYSYYVGIDNVSANNNFLNVYPNPAKDNLIIELKENKVLQNTSVSIYNIQGQLLKQLAVKEDKTEIDIHSFATGVYIVTVNNEKENYVSKFVKE